MQLVCLALEENIFFSGAIDCKSRGIAPYRKWLPKRGKILDALAFHKKACVSSGESFFFKKKKVNKIKKYHFSPV